MTSSHQPENDTQPDDEGIGAFKGILEELENTLRIGFEGMVANSSPNVIELSRVKFSIQFEYKEYSMTPDPNIMVPDDNRLWFTLFRHFVDRCDSWKASPDDLESIELLLPFASSQDKQSSHPAALFGAVDEQFVECIMQNAEGKYGQIRWFNFTISSAESGFHFTTEHNGTEFIVATNVPNDVDYLRKTVPKSMRLNIWSLDDSA